jgi:sRNA-binding protein
MATIFAPDRTRMTILETSEPEPIAGRASSKKTHVLRQKELLALWADWRRRWPAAFTKPVPLAVGFSGQIKAALRAEGLFGGEKGYAIHRWTMQSAYLRAVERGEMRRNLDGSEAGVPDDEARAKARKLLEQRAARHAEKERHARQRQEERRAAVASQ